MLGPGGTGFECQAKGSQLNLVGSREPPEGSQLFRTPMKEGNQSGGAEPKGGERGVENYSSTETSTRAVVVAVAVRRERRGRLSDSLVQGEGGFPGSTCQRLRLVPYHFPRLPWDLADLPC